MVAPRYPALESLRVFEAAARTLSFTAAGAELGVTQSAVSLRIRDLEAELRLTLFLRTRPRLTLTADGARLARDLSQAFAGVRRAVDRVRPDPRRVKLAVTPTFAARWLAARLPRFEAETGHTIEMTASVELQRLGPGDFDLAIRSGHGDWPGLEIRRLFLIERTPMLSPALAGTLAEGPAGLADAPLLGDGWPAWFAAAGLDPALPNLARTPYATQDLLAEAVVSGAGAGLLSPAFFAPLVKDGRLIAPFRETLVGPDAYYVVRPPDGPAPPAAAFLDWLARELPADRP
jgi:LysR family glycine cleavage system transcriptional activator